MRARMLAAVLVLVLGSPSLAQAPPDNQLKQAFEQSLVDIAAAARWQHLVCRPDVRINCAAGKCAEAPATVQVVLKREPSGLGTVSRCSGGTCDIYEATFNLSGIFTTGQSTVPRGHFVKVLGEREYVEVASIGVVIIVSSGKCERLR